MTMIVQDTLLQKPNVKGNKKLFTTFLKKDTQMQHVVPKL